MVQQVDPFIYPIPKKILADPELRPYFEYFHRWAHDMWKRTGGSSDDVADTGLRETYPWLQEHNTDDQQQNVYNVENVTKQEFSYPVQSYLPEITTKTLSREAYTAVDFGFYNATNNSTLFLPESPCRNSFVGFNKDSTTFKLNGNGKTVNRKSGDIRFSNPGLSRICFYFIDSDEWLYW